MARQGALERREPLVGDPQSPRDRRDHGRSEGLDVTDPGLWMAHCHIAEHHESGMILSFEVAPAAGA